MPEDLETMFAPSVTTRELRADGTFLLRSPLALGSFARCVGDWLVKWAREAPERNFLLERDGSGAWQRLAYGEALQKVVRISSWLLTRNPSAERPVCILSDNSIEHALLSLAAMHIGVPVVPVSPAYSLMSSDFSKLRTIIELTQPSVIFVGDSRKFSKALEAIAKLHQATLVTGVDSEQSMIASTQFSSIAKYPEDPQVERAFSLVDCNTIAKVLFTSGSTGEPKGVITTQRMLCSNQQALRQIWPFVCEEPPVLVDWLPWNHTFGGSFDFNLVLCNGGTFYIDAGRPVSGLFDQTISNLREVAPTIQFNVPRGFDLLVGALRQNAQLREKFFSRLRVIFYAAASLSPHVWDALIELSIQTLGRQVPLVSAWGSTETAPLAAACHYQAERSGVIGVPIPGCELKLTPCGGEKLEVRVRGPNVTPGYWKRPQLTEDAFDAEGFYRIGDAMKFLDPARPDLGLLFDGRVAEDFKLASGTWVNVGALRIKAIAALAPIAQDIVLAGHDRDEICFLVFPNIAACRSLCPRLPSDLPVDQLLANQTIRAHLKNGLAALHRDGMGSSTHAARALLMSELPSIDRSEINDKGYINQRSVLAHRAALVNLLYGPGDPRVVSLHD